MRQWDTSTVGRLIDKSYKYGRHLCVDECLRLAFRISQENQFHVTHVWIDEPSGMDSDWQHYDSDGAFLQDIREDDFIKQYKDLDLEWITLKGDVEKNIIKYYIGREQIKVAAFPNTPEKIMSTALAIAEKHLDAIEQQCYNISWNGDSSFSCGDFIDDENELEEEISLKEAIEIARDFIPDQYVLDCCTDIGDEYWFNYKRPDGKTIIGASLVSVNKETKEVLPRSFTEDFPYVRRTWNNAEKIIVPPTQENAPECEIDPVISDYMEAVGVNNKTHVYRAFHVNPDICNELKCCIAQDSCDVEDPISIEGYTAKDISELAPFMNYLGIYNFLITLRTEPEKAKDIIAQDFPRK